MFVAIIGPGARQNSFLIQQHTAANVVLHHFCELLLVRLAVHARPSTPVFALRVLWNAITILETPLCSLQEGLCSSHSNSQQLFDSFTCGHVTAGECTHHLLKETLRISYTLFIPSACEFVIGDRRVFRPIQSRSALFCDHRARLSFHTVVVHQSLHAVQERVLSD